MDARYSNHLSLATAVYQKSLPVCIIIPMSGCRHAIGQLAKTDKMDARVITEYAVVKQTVPTPIVICIPRIIRDLIILYKQVMVIRAQELNWLQSMVKTLESSCRRILRTLDAEIH